MKRNRTAIATVLLVVAPLLAAAGEVVPLGGEATALAVEHRDRGEELLVASVGEMRLDEVRIDGARWAVVTVPGGHNLMERALPSLPELASSYLLGDHGGVRVVLEEVRTADIDLGARGFAGVAPSKGHFDRSTPYGEVPFEFDPKVYGGDRPFPESFGARIGDPYIAGPLRGQAVTVPVARWNPASNVLTVVTEATFRIEPTADRRNPRLRERPALTAPFAAAARRTLNPEREGVDGGRTVAPGRLLILAADELATAVEPLADWQRLVGYPTMLVTLSQAGVTTATGIHSYIQSLYDEPEGLAWIVLVGDEPQLPTLRGVNESARCDPCFTKLEGADNRPDAAISRLSGQSKAEIEVQVDKILAYERMPIVDPAADDWYGAAFGIASDEGSPRDWERMNALRDVLLPGGFTEFTELYDNHFPYPSGSGDPSPSNVAATVNLGTSLGLYIGHGSETAWVSSGFSVSHVNSLLTNGDMLPVVWDVACVNGAFHRTSGDCFAEAWMKKVGGGAVSFEAATTNESWVPPCIAQAAVVDAVVDRTAHTTGAQHVAGKLALMDSPTGGDSNGSEGTRFMEQSHLFGVATMWPRTGPASVPDEPVDYALAGGTATLTVTVGGQPLAEAGGAIVSFYELAGAEVVPVGAGLVDANGVVAAPVTGDPTHCHVHGRDLVPTSFELSARPEGRVSLDRPVYSCASGVGLRVSDSNAAAGSPATVDVTLAAGGDSAVVTLTETEPGSGFFTGAAVLGTDLQVAHGDLLTATYHDADDGQGGASDRTATADVDCAGPLVSAVEAVPTESRITFRFTTDEPATTVIRYGDSPALGQVVADDVLTTAHEITVDGVDPCTTYHFVVESADALGNLGVADDGGAPFTADTAGWQVFLAADLATDPGWAISNGGHPSTGWAWGQPTGAGQDSYGGPDPTSGATGATVYGVNLAGDISPNLSTNEQTLTTPPIDLSDASSAQLRFQRWLGVERDTYDNARIRLSVDGGGSWTTLWENGSETIDDTAWSEMVVPLPDTVLGQPDVRIQWTYGSTDGSWNYCGWNIDDVVVEGAAPCVQIEPMFADGFESGDCVQWSDEVPGL